MATDPTSTAAVSAPKPLSPAVRKRLQQCYEFGRQKRKQGDHAYAHSMFAQAVLGDPSNLIYLETMLDNLAELHNDKRRKARVRSNRNPLKKAVQAQDWPRVFEQGIALLEENPWDVQTLRAVASACEAQHFNEVELRYLKNALDGDPKDVDVNRHCATSLARMGQFDQAIACWHRIEELKPGHDEAKRMISDLTLEKNRAAAGFADEAAPAAAESQPETTAAPPPPESPAELQASLEQKISEDPSEVRHYLELAELHERADHWKEAEQVLRQAVHVAGHDLQVRERWEESQLRIAKRQLAIAEQRARSSADAAARKLAHQLAHDVNRLEINIYERRCQRYPDKHALNFELAARLKRAGLYEAAAKQFQVAAHAPELTASATVQLGECLQQLRQYEKALQAYQIAIRRADERAAPEVAKLARYRAAVLANGMKRVDVARSYLQELVELDPGYRDARTRLDNLAAM